MRAMTYQTLRRMIFGAVVLNVLVIAALLVVSVRSGDDATAAPPTDAPARTVDETPTTATTPARDEPIETEVAGEVEFADALIPPANEADPIPVPAQPVKVLAEPPAFPDPWTATANEVQPAAKELGSLVAHLITNYEPDTTLNGVLGALPPVPEDFALQVVQETQRVHHAGMWSRGTVEYAQLGGHLNGRISIIVVVRQELGLDGIGEPERVEKRTMEVRLHRAESGAWELETIATSGGDPVERPDDLSDRAAAVVDHERIDLPDTGVWDIYAGRINEQLLWVMLDIAERTPYKVVVLQTGHSYNVFGTNRVSNHSVGRAVDIYMLETEVIIDAHDPSSEFYALSEWIVSRYDIREFGSPWKFPDAVAHTFTNEVHHDHLHIGVQSYPTSPEPPPTTTTVPPPVADESD